MSAPYTAATIARWFIKWAGSDEGDISNLKLQKLLYYAQGHHLGERGGPLFDDAIQAWSHGPVVPDIYHEYKRFGSSDVELDERDAFDWDEVDPDTTEFLIDVWDSYGGYGAWRLRNMTHSEPPWVDAFQAGARYVVIPQEAMQKFFAVAS